MQNESSTTTTASPSALSFPGLKAGVCRANPIKPRHCTPSTRPGRRPPKLPNKANVKGTDMALTRNFKHTIVERVDRDPAFAKALLDEAATSFLNGEPDVARLILRDLVNATVGFDQLAELTHKPSKSLHRMLSPKGNPSMDNLAAIFGAVRMRLKVGIAAHTIEVS